MPDAPYFMRVKFTLKTNTPDEFFENRRAEQLARRFFGSANVYEWTELTLVPENEEPVGTYAKSAEEM